MPELSIVIPIMNEEDNVQPMIEAVDNALHGFDYELIFVDDGSSDETKPRLKKLVNDRIKLVELRKNYGQSTAMTAGIDHANAEYIAMIDGDLQNDPADIPRLVAEIEKGADLVCGYRAKRQDSLSKKLTSRFANSVRSRFTGDGVRDTAYPRGRRGPRDARRPHLPGRRWGPLAVVAPDPRRLAETAHPPDSRVGVVCPRLGHGCQPRGRPPPRF